MEVIEAGGTEGSKLIRQASTNSVGGDDKVQSQTLKCITWQSKFLTILLDADLL